MLLYKRADERNCLVELEYRGERETRSTVQRVEVQEQEHVSLAESRSSSPAANPELLTRSAIRPWPPLEPARRPRGYSEAEHRRLAGSFDRM